MRYEIFQRKKFLELVTGLLLSCVSGTWYASCVKSSCRRRLLQRLEYEMNELVTVI